MPETAWWQMSSRPHSPPIRFIPSLGDSQLKNTVVFATSRGARFSANQFAAAPQGNGHAPRKAASIVAFVLFLLACSMAWGQNDPVTTYHFDGARTGQATDETILVPANVNSTRFGKLFSYPVDGLIVAQPLYVPNVTLPGLGTHNVVYVVTMHDSVYAFDADTSTGTPLWKVSFINPSAGVTTVPISEQLCSGTGFTEIGIMGTPVIDTTTGTGTLYLSVKTREQSGSTVNYVHRLHALDITTGADKTTPVVVDASVVNSLGNTVWFHTNNLPQCQRPALLLSNGTLFVAYGSNGCDLHSFGWVMAYNPSNLQQLAVFNTAPTPNPNLQTGASLWMSGGGIAVDDAGYLYISTANGPYDGIMNWGDSVLKLQFQNNNSITVADYFSPFDQSTMAINDKDLGSGGVTLIPDQPGLNPHLLVTSGKSGNIYLINRDGMGGYNPGNNPPLNDNSNIVQYLPAALKLFNSVPVYWSGNNQVYFAGRNGDPIKAFQLVNGAFFPSTPVAQSAAYAQSGIPVISSSGSTGGILWNLYNPPTPYLSALDATTLTELYNSNQKATRDTLGNVTHFANIMIANNKVFVGTFTNLSVYGVLPYMTVQGGNAQTAAAGTGLPTPLTVQAVNSQGVGVAGVTVTFSESANGAFNPPTAITDSTGTATTSYTLPAKVGTFSITASAPGFRNVVLTATSVPGPASVIAKISGVGQYGTVGTALAPLVVNLRDAHTNGIVGQQITFTDGGAGGSFSANPVTTGAAGAASVTYTLPTKQQYVVITATSGGVSAAAAEHAVAGPANSVSIWSGNNQSVKVSTQLVKPLIALVTDQYGNKLPGITVTYSDGGAGGTFSATTATTNAGGQTSVTYIAPATAQVVSIKATVSGLTPVTFTETVHN